MATPVSSSPYFVWNLINFNQEMVNEQSNLECILWFI